MPHKEIEYDEVENLAAQRCTQHDIAVFLGWNVDAFSTRKKHDAKLREAMRRGYARFNIDLQKAQFTKAITNQDTKMLIHLGTCYLGQKEKLEISGDAKHPVAMSLVDIVSRATKAKESGELDKPIEDEEEELDDYESFDSEEEADSMDDTTE
jgi:hypothetical protein